MAEQVSGARVARRVEQARQQEARKIARRSFLRVSVFAGLSLGLGAWLASIAVPV